MIINIKTFAYHFKVMLQINFNYSKSPEKPFWPPATDPELFDLQGSYIISLSPNGQQQPDQTIIPFL